MLCGPRAAGDLAVAGAYLAAGADLAELAVLALILARRTQNFGRLRRRHG